MKILIVDDSPAEVRLMQAVLEQAGYWSVAINDPAFAAACRRFGLPLNMVEVGASGGLLSNWDHYWYDCFGQTAGEGSSVVRFTNRWTDPFPLDGLSRVARRTACDIAPLDVAGQEGRLRLLSFVWPDQHDRLALLRSALDVAAAHPPSVEQQDAADFLARELPARPRDTLTIVFHSIVWQYLPRTTKERMREVLHTEGAQAGADNPISWVRMEPAGAVADVRVTTWPGGREQVVALTSYHGADVRQPPADTRET